MPTDPRVGRGRPKQYTEKRVTTAVRLPEALHQRLTEEAEGRDTSINHLLVRAATYYLDLLPPLAPREKDCEGR